MTPPSPEPQPEGNPFATRWVRPGAIEYLFPPGDDTEGLVETLRRNAWWGEIVGPHGSGKSTLLESLAEPLQQAGRRLVRFTLHDGQRQLPAETNPDRHWGATTQVVVDGYEQLSRHSRRRLQSACRRRESGLLTTAHAPTGLPRLYETVVTLEQARRIVAGLLAPAPGAILDEDVADCFARCDGNLREMLFALYDLYEQRRP